MLLWLFWGACDPGVETVDPDASEMADTPDPEVETVDPPEVDTPQVDTPDTNLPVDPTPTPPSLGAGFVDLVPSIVSDLQLAPDPLPSANKPPDETWVAFGDLGDDGVMDAIFAQVLRPASDEGDRVGSVYSYQGGVLVFNATHTAAVQRAYGPITAALDLDGDGDTDLVRASTEATFQLAAPDGWTTWDLGVPDGVPFIGGLWTGNAMDIDHDGWLDWMFMPDPCSGDVHWSALPVLRTGLHAWARRDDLVALLPSGDAYATIQAPLGGEQPWIVQVGQGCDELAGPPDFLQITEHLPDGAPRYDFFDPTPANALFRLNPGGAGFDISRHQPMGGTVVDLDHDGVLELVVSLAEAEVTVLSAGATMVDRTPAAGLTLPLGWHGEPELPWGVAPVDLDQDGSADLVIAHGDDSRIWFADHAHYDHPTTAWWNDGAGVFVPLDGTGLGALGDWRGIAVGDLDGDADPDIAIGGFGHMPAIYQNHVEIGHHTLALTLAGTTSNHLGFGAVVVLEADGLPRQTRLMGEMASPDQVSPAALFFGMGDATRAHLTVTWPSGVVQEADVDADQTVHLAEPVLIALSELDRHVGPGQTVTVEVTPRDAQGGLRSVGAVDIGSPFTPVAWTGPVVRDGDVWRRTFVPPDVGDSAVIEVSVDGLAVPIRPRVWFDR